MKLQPVAIVGDVGVSENMDQNLVCSDEFVSPIS
jgi:hypothetical protein